LHTVLITVLSIIFFLLCFWALVLLFYYGGITSPAKHSASGSGARGLFRIIFLSFMAVYLYQASWQLAGFSRPAFMDFMRKYSRRPVNPAREMVRGRILDRSGVELAVNDPADNRLRRYPLGSLFCHLVGYMDPIFGLDGLEAADNAFLSGYSLSSSDEVGRFSLNILNHRKVGGNDLVLTIDTGLQKTAADLLKNKRGAIVALQPEDGSIIALTSSPAYNPQALDAALFNANRGASPLFNRALHGLYPPGSTFKIAVAACALEQGFHETLDCPGQGYIPPGPFHRPIRDHQYYEHQRNGEAWPGWGRIGIEQAFARSSNVFFAQLGVRLGSSQLNAIAQRFLFNQPLLLFAGSSSNISTQPSFWPILSEKDSGDSAQQAIGQGSLLVTPFHMALITAAIAQNGELYAPRIAVRTPARLLGRLVDQRIAGEIKRLMRHTVERGTAVGANIKGITIAGKTGTAQAPDGEDHSWFICFAPVERPAIAVAVLIEHGGYGAAAALPVAVELIKKAKSLGLLEKADVQTPVMGAKNKTTYPMR
jgi:penicillin-binding protein A